jgi:hypothetical protein
MLVRRAEARSPVADAAPHAITLERLDGGLLVLDGLALTRAFFAGDAGTVGAGSSDSFPGLGLPDTIGTDDVREMNRTMRARSPHEAWATVVDRPLPWLAAIGPDLDLIQTDDDAWAASDAERLVGAALRETIAPRRGLAVATKMLHLKRPRLFPMLDEFVAVMLGRNVATGTPAERKVAIGMELLLHLRHQGRRNIRPLGQIQNTLRNDGVERSLVRILDAAIWCSHPAAGISGGRRTICVSIAGSA